MPALGPGGGARPWTPADGGVGPSLYTWHDAADTTTFDAGAAGAQIATWRDKSGNGVHLTQATSAKQPTSSGARAGKTCLAFSGSQAISGATVNKAQPITVVIAFRLSSAGDFYMQGSGGAGPQIYSDGSASIFKSGVGGASANGGSTDTRAHIISAQFSGATSEIYTDGQVGTPASFATTAMAYLVLGAYRTDGFLGMPGEIYESTVWSGSLGAVGRGTVERYLSAKWGIPLAVGGACSPPLVFA